MVKVDTPEYWQSKLGKFTASMVHKLFTDKKGTKKDSEIVFGDGAVTYIKQKVAEVLSGKPNEVYSKSLEWGIENEAAAVFFYEWRYGVKLQYTNENQRFIPYGMNSGATPDGLQGRKAIVQFKCPYDRSEHVSNLIINNEEDFRKYHPDYYCQIQTEIAATNREIGYFASFSPMMYKEELMMHRIEIKRNEDFISELNLRIGKASEMRDEMILKILNSKLT